MQTLCNIEVSSLINRTDIFQPCPIICLKIFDMSIKIFYFSSEISALASSSLEDRAHQHHNHKMRILTSDRYQKIVISTMTDIINSLLNLQYLHYKTYVLFYNSRQTAQLLYRQRQPGLPGIWARRDLSRLSKFCQQIFLVRPLHNCQEPNQNSQGPLVHFGLMLLSW